MFWRKLQNAQIRQPGIVDSIQFIYNIQLTQLITAHVQLITYSLSRTARFCRFGCRQWLVNHMLGVVAREDLFVASRCRNLDGKVIFLWILEAPHRLVGTLLRQDGNQHGANAINHYSRWLPCINDSINIKYHYDCTMMTCNYEQSCATMFTLLYIFFFLYV